MRARLMPPLDMISRDGESVALVEHTVVRLSHIATVMLDLLDASDWTDASALVDGLERRLGPPPDGVNALDVTESALRDLAQQGLVTCLTT